MWYTSLFIMVLKQIRTKNIQNHRDVVVDLPPTGLVVFSGQNSNGKSVIGKTTRTLLNGDLRKPRKRASLVNKNSAFGEITYIREDDTELTLHLAREASLTYVRYKEPNQEPIVRYLADKSYSELISRFGWHYDADSGISLNLAEMEDALLFYKTSNKINGTVLETATSDKVADRIAEQFDNTLKETRNYRDNWMQQVRNMESALVGLKIEDVTSLNEKIEKIKYYLRNIKSVKFPSIPPIEAVPQIHYTDIKYPVIIPIKAVPNVHYANVIFPSLPKIKYPKIYNISCELPDITQTARELNDLRNCKCPTCGRGFNICDC